MANLEEAQRLSAVSAKCAVVLIRDDIEKNLRRWRRNTSDRLIVGNQGDRGVYPLFCVGTKPPHYPLGHRVMVPSNNPNFQARPALDA